MGSEWLLRWLTRQTNRISISDDSTAFPSAANDGELSFDGMQRAAKLAGDLEVRMAAHLSQGDFAQAIIRQFLQAALELFLQ